MILVHDRFIRLKGPIDRSVDLAPNWGLMTVKIPFDYHMHSNNSCDCRVTMAEMCQSALQKGIPEIAFTEHFNRIPEDMCFDKYVAAPFLLDIEARREKFGPQGLRIKPGSEWGDRNFNGAQF